MNILRMLGLYLILLSSASAQQVCKDDVITSSTPNSRFVLNEAEATDRQTNLVWMRCTVGQSWNTSSQQCDGDISLFTWKESLLLTNNQWRLPNIKELLTIVEHACYEPALNLSVFKGVVQDNPSFGIGYWSSTVPLFTYASDGAYGVIFNEGELVAFDKWANVAVRLVKNAD